MSVRCSNCGRENADGMKFCTNCGTALAQATIPTPTTSGFNPNPAVTPTVKKSGSGKNLAIFGGLGCLALLILGVLGAVGLVYLAQSSGKNTANTGNYNLSNSSVPPNKNSNSSAVNANSKTPTNVNSNTEDNPNDIPVVLPETIGSYEKTNSINANPVDEFPGALEVNKSSYAKGARKADVVFAKFSSPSSAKENFDYFINGQKSSGAKISVRQKIKNKSGVVNGEAALYKNKNFYEIILYADKYGFRIMSTDSRALQEFATDFGKAMKGIEDIE